MADSLIGGDNAVEGATDVAVIEACILADGGELRIEHTELG